MYILEYPSRFMIQSQYYDAKPIPVSSDQQQHNALITYRQMHE